MSKQSGSVVVGTPSNDGKPMTKLTESLTNPIARREILIGDVCVAAAVDPFSLSSTT
jgi:hypothetical protein